jgi:hypothetical protein
MSQESTANTRPREIDARLAQWPWLAEALLENMPAEGYPPAPGGFLDVDSAWAQVLRLVLDLSSDHSVRPDLLAILKWSLEHERVDRYARLSERAKRQVTAWLSEAMGAPGKLAIQCIQAGFASELAPVGLMCGIVFHEHAEHSAALMAAAVRLEKYFGGSPIYPGEARHLYQGARKLLDGLDPIALDRVLEAGDRLFQSLHLPCFAQVSDDLPSGFEARLTALGESIRAYLEHPGGEAAASVAIAADHATRHRLSERAGLRKTRIEMATRLIRRLEQERQRPQATAADLRRCISDYVQDGTFIDRARLSLLGGDELASLTQSYNALRERIRGLRERQNRRFAESLSAWLDTGCGPVADVLPVEKIVDEIVAPLARKAPVLLLVVDGLSYPIFTEIVEDALKSGWSEILPIDQSGARAGVATIPSITEISRASLLCGRLCAGQAAQEKAGFAAHPALTAASRANAKPIVFHKGELSDSLDLSDQVRNAVGRADQKVVAVVYNGVDDHLSGSDQLQPHWKLDDLRLLRPLFYEARLAGRVIVITSDHGHVLDEAIVSSGLGLGDRWRSCETGPGPQEMRLEGGRVLAPTGERQVVVPWSESLRYSQKKNGYHGGISLQEMIVPICLLTAGAVPEGYRLVGPSFPVWWESLVPSTVAAPVEKTIPPLFPEQLTKIKKVPTSDNRQKTLFDDEEAFQAEPHKLEDWIESLLSSSMFRSQKQLAARAALRDDEIRHLLEALEERGGKMSKPALAQRLGLPLMRVSGFVNAARRLLNVDQVNVLTLDEADGSITLNRALLETQFKEAFVKPPFSPGKV